MLNAADTALIRRQTAAMIQLGHGFGAECLARAFWANPWLRAHLPRDVHGLRSEITLAMDAVVATIDRPERLDAVVAALLVQAGGERQPPRVLLVLAEALIATLRSRLEDEFTAEAETAWRALLAVLYPRLAAPESMPHAA